MSFTLAEWQQAKRGGHDPKALKQMFRELWASSDSKRAFAAALQSRGYTLARGDRRGHVAVDYALRHAGRPADARKLAPLNADVRFQKS